MEDPNKKDVPVDSSSATDADKDKVETADGGGNDKDKNFAELRKKTADLEKEVEELRKKVPADKQDDEPDTSELSAAEKVAFERDQKEATIQFVSKHKLTDEQIKAIREGVTFSGKEVPSEIVAKYQEAYEALPEVKAAREKALIDKGRREAMREFSDDEMDIGGSGDIDTGGDSAPRLTGKENKFLKSFGVSDEEAKKIDKSANPNEWQPGKAPTRAAFQAPK